jgi:predicted small lipoprotein YifL
MSWLRTLALLLILGTLGGCARIGPGSVAPPPSQGDRNGMH